jgi:hypothetical protein
MYTCGISNEILHIGQLICANKNVEIKRCRLTVLSAGSRTQRCWEPPCQWQAQSWGSAELGTGVWRHAEKPVLFKRLTNPSQGFLISSVGVWALPAFPASLLSQPVTGAPAVGHSHGGLLTGDPPRTSWMQPISLLHPLCQGEHPLPQAATETWKPKSVEWTGSAARRHRICGGLGEGDSEEGKASVHPRPSVYMRTPSMKIFASKLILLK